MSDRLRAECDALTRYLIGRPADDYVRHHYVRGVETLGLRPTRFDRVLCRWARGPRLVARGADFYGRLFRPSGALRKRLVLLLAILESYGPTAEVTDRSPGAPGFFRFVASAAGVGLVSAAALAFSAPLLLPLQLLLRGSDA